MFSYPFQGQLPVEVVTGLAEDHLTVKDLLVSSSVSKDWQNFFTQPKLLRTRIQRDFGMHHAALNELDSASFKDIYKRLLTLKRKSTQFPAMLKFIYTDQTQSSLILACCTDDLSYVEENVLREDYGVCFELALYAGSNRLVLALLNSCPELRTDFLEKAIFAKNLEMVKFGLENLKKFEFSCYPEMFSNAIYAGELDVLFYLLSHKNTIDFTLDEATVYAAIKLGNVELVKQLLAEKNTLKLDAKAMLNIAISSGHLELMSYFLDESGFDFETDRTTIMNAALSGNLTLVLNLLDRSPQIKLTPAVLCAAAQSGNLELLTHFLHRQTGHNLKSNYDTLKGAVVSGKLTLVSYLIDNFELAPDDELVELAISAGYTDIALYFLDSQNGFDIEITEQMMMNAIETGSLALVSFLCEEQLFTLEFLNQIALKGNLDLMRQLLSSNSSLKPDLTTLRNAAASQNYGLFYYLLDPNNGFELIPTEDMLVLNNVLRRNLFLSVLAGNELREALKNNQPDLIKQFAQETYDHSAKHFSSVVECIAKEGDTFCEEAIQCLAGFISEKAAATHLPKVEAALLQRMTDCIAEKNVRRLIY